MTDADATIEQEDDSPIVLLNIEAYGSFTPPPIEKETD